MTATATAPARQAPNRADLAPWLIVALGLAVMYVPSFIDLFNGIWSTDQQGHGPIVLAISLWLIYRKWGAMCTASAGSKPNAAGWLVLIIGILFFVLGRSQNIVILEVGSLVWSLAGVLLIIRGWHALKAQWFSLFFMLFMVPLPEVVVTTLTMPMKMAVSYAAESIMVFIGYPVARSGVILYVGQYQLLVADACAGLHTLFTLEALGLLYLNVISRDSFFRNMALAALIVPISFSANVIRVIVLSLVTFHFGDEAGQGFLHGFAGMVLFISALLLIIGVDAFIHWIERLRMKHVATGAV